MVLTTPLLARLATEGTVDVVCTPAAGGCWRTTRGARRDRLRQARDGSGHRGPAKLADALRHGRTTRHFSPKARCEAAHWRRGGHPRTRRIQHVGRARFYTRAFRIERSDHHAARLLALADRGARVEAANARSATQGSIPGDGNAPRSMSCCARRGGPTAGRPRAGQRLGDQTMAVLRRARARPARQRSIAVVGAAADRRVGRGDRRTPRGVRPIDATGRLTLLASAELIGRAALLVTNDSAPLHLASAMNTPTIAVFGPTVPEFGFGPLADSSPRRRSAKDPRVPAVRPAWPANVPSRTLALHARDFTGEVAAGARALLLSSLLSGASKTPANEEAAPVHHRRRSGRHEHRRRRDVRRREASLRHALDPDERRVWAQKAWPIGIVGLIEGVILDTIAQTNANRRDFIGVGIGAPGSTGS